MLKAAMGDLLEEMQAGDGIARGPPWAQQHQQMPSQVRRFTYPNTTMSTASPRPSPPQPPPVQIVKASTSSRRHTTRHHSRRPSDLYGHSPSVTYGSAPIPTSSSTQQAVASRSALAQHARTSTSSLASISETPADHHPERRRPSRRDSVSTARETASATVLQSYQDLPTVVVSRPTPTGTPGPPSGGSETEGDQRPRRRTRGSHASPSPSRPESVSSLVGARGGYCGSRDSPSIDTHTQGPGYGYDSGASSPTISRTPSTVAVPAATTTTSSVDPAGIDSGSGSAMQIGAAEGLRDLGLNEEDISGPGPTWEEWLRKNPRPGPGSVTSYTGSVGGGSVTGHGSSTMGRAGSVDSGEQNW